MLNKIQLDVERPVKYNFNAFEEFEDLTGKNAFGEVDFASAKVLKALAYVGCKCANPQFSLSYDEVGEYLQMNTDTVQAIMTAYMHSMGLDIASGNGKKK